MVGHPPSLHPAAQGGRGEAPVPCGTWPADGPPPHPRGVTGRGGGRPRRCARAAVGHHRQPRAARSQAPRDGPGADRRAQPALPPRRGGEGWARRPAYLRGRTRGRGGGRDPAAGDRGWSDLGVGGTKGAEATLRRPQPRPGKSPGAIDDRATLRQA
ncbi:hypothetical protein NDU88_000830 [Pleurodeles waltl]|uniref:Uncharacterized protein n=1 Tax=Pleurodeles waltl TaxID=8319 RepID=A0AAV7U634_PLEWA|nr:hypothetical protein NDU88_000778 [Pleurodeles waltl]KAJ1183989.1 hypothetical protein NDU88_000799 [Pleurodeles waltl]KAJ1183995.1 hypothetical protein NDU88_000805 [Pleurodeles waltl]KAJ1183997.1 hypothetical protein NDU88_000807 [Pleurodeles waltl]KAJ1184007.1 hypothetical protein NDU88_000817 [Pleurodeles waltl]